MSNLLKSIQKDKIKYKKLYENTSDDSAIKQYYGDEYDLMLKFEKYVKQRDKNTKIK